MTRHLDRSTHPAAGARLIVGGLAAGASLMLVGSMAAAARTAESAQAPSFQRIVVVNDSSGASSVVLVAQDAVSGSRSRQLAGDAPRPAARAAQAQAESGGS